MTTNSRDFSSTLFAKPLTRGQGESLEALLSWPTFEWGDEDGRYFWRNASFQQRITRLAYPGFRSPEIRAFGTTGV